MRIRQQALERRNMNSMFLVASLWLLALSSATAFSQQTRSKDLRGLVITSTTRPSTSLLVASSTSSSSSAEQSSPPPPEEGAIMDLNDTDVVKRLCNERNLPFDVIKNARDLASVANSPIRPGRIYRMGRLSDASDADIATLHKEIDLRTLVDLRSPTELKDDPTLQRREVFSPFVDIVWKERGNDGCIRELEEGEFPVRKPFWSRMNGKELADAFVADDDCVDDIDADCGIGCEKGSIPASARGTTTDNTSRKERHFVSLMNEFKYVKGTVSKLRKRDLTKALLKSPGAAFSRRVRTSIKKPFLDEINDGGLPMLNELLLRFGAPGIKYVLELVADRNRHPISFYCTAGKDRTGMVTAIILALCGAKTEDIVQDYTLSANVYAEMNDHKAMVGALSQRNLDPKTFLGAPPQVMKDTLDAINESYGSVEGYCNWIGFGPEKQEQLRHACMDE